jgi:single-stranded-DNA-specific exonuclease
VRGPAAARGIAAPGPVMSALTHRRFRLPPPAPADAMAAELGVPVPLARLLLARGLCTPREAALFLDPPPPADPEALPGVTDGVARLLEARRRDDGVLIYGDYDCDGVCSALLAAEGLAALGFRVAVHLPGRADGYGMREDTLPRLASGSGCRLVLAVDNGATAHGPIAAAAAAGLDVIVADHHQCDATLPAAAAFVNPVLAPGGPYAGLAGVGVTWVLLQALARALRAPAPAGLDLVALGTIADVAPLCAANRHLVRAGLRAMAGPDVRPGLRALLAAAGVAAGTVPSARDVSHGLAPRCNAPGRVDHPDLAYALLAAAHPQEAAAALARVEQCNRARQALAEQVAAEAEAAVEAGGGRASRAVVLARPTWHPGVVGVAAARLADRLGVPVLLGAVDAAGCCRGSGRGPEGFDLTAALRACGHLLRRYGGHARAAGFELEASRLEALQEALSGLAPAASPAPERLLDGEIRPEELRLDLAEALERLEPLGEGNPEPLFLLRNAGVEDVRTLGREERHVRFRIRAPGTAAAGVEAVAFGFGPWVDGLCERGPFDLVVRPEVDRFRGRAELQVVVADALPRGGDWRPFLAAVRRGLPLRHPDRDQLVGAFRRLRELAPPGAPLPPEPDVVAALAPACGGSTAAARAALRIFEQVGLIDPLGRLSPPSGGAKVDLGASPRFRAAEEARRALARLEAAAGTA